jgi:hypothetical protein
MTIEEIQARINQIKEKRYDSEKAHILEAELREKFIEYVAQLNRIPHLQEKAALVLKTKQIEFKRWFA